MKLYWLICAGLLLAGTVEAGEPAQCEYVLASGHLRNSCELLEIDPGVNPILQNASFIACYQRMREAMTAMDKYLLTAMEAQQAKTLPIEDVRFWQAVMRECVQ